MGSCGEEAGGCVCGPFLGSEGFEEGLLEPVDCFWVVGFGGVEVIEFDGPEVGFVC